ncbi:hypothetical protein FBU59_003256, partial [Linderina macrospora]
MAIAENIPNEILHDIFEHLWDEEFICTFITRRRSTHHEHDQRHIHHLLRTRQVSPIHVCRTWRAAGRPQFFRSLVLTGSNPHADMLQLVERAFVEVGTGGILANTLVSGPMARARTLGLSFAGSQSENSHWPGVLQQKGFAEQFPNIMHVWVQCVGDVGGQLIASLYGLLHKVTSLHLGELTRRNPESPRLVRACSSSLQVLSVGSVSGGVLADALFHDGHQVEYPNMSRFVFGVDSRANIHSGQRPLPRCPFPNMRELHFDDTLSLGPPRESWYAPLYDTLLKYDNMALQYLTFPVIYNTQRTVSRRNCPELVELRQIKCCWATGPWEVGHSDSTRVLTAIATIPKLQKYVHPSYIAGLTGVPASIECTSLRYLDLYGWPLTISDMAWVMASFSRLQTLRVTLASGGGMVDVSGNYACSVKNLVVGATGGALALPELHRLFAVLASMPCIDQLVLYSDAYAHVRSELLRLESHEDIAPRLGRAHITNLDHFELSGGGQAPGDV